MSTKKPAAAAVPDWQTEEDLRHLTRAHQVKKDPNRHKAAMALAKQRMQEMRDATSMSPDDPAAGDADNDGV